MEEKAAAAAAAGVSISNKETTNSRNNIESIHITEDLTLILVPRIKLNFICGCTRGFCDIMMQESYLKGFVVHGFRSSEAFRRTPLTIPKEDVHVRYYSLPRRTDDMAVIAEGFLFYRDPSLMNRQVRDKLRDFMLQRFPGYRHRIASGSAYMVKYSLPPSEDCDKILTSVSSGEVPPTLVIKGFPTHWFVDQSGSSQPSTQLLRMFFEKFGNVRDIHVEEVVSVKYEDGSYLYKALECLCGCSLQKHGSGETVDYDFILNEEQGLCKKKRALEYDLLLPPSKRLNVEDAFKQLVKTEIDEEDVKKHVKTEVDEEDVKKHVKTEVDEEIKQVKTMVYQNLKAFLSNLHSLF